MSLHGDEDMDQLLQESQPPSPQNIADPPPDLDDNLVGLGGGGRVSVADNLVPVPAVITTTAAFPDLHPQGPNQHLLLQRAQDGQARQDQLRLLQQALVQAQGVPPILLWHYGSFTLGD